MRNGDEFLKIANVNIIFCLFFFFFTTKPLKILALRYLALYLKSHLSLPLFISIILIYISFSIFWSHGGYIIL